MYYSGIGLIAIIVHLIINVEYLGPIRRGPNIPLVRVRYQRFLYSVLAYYITDVLWGILYELDIIVPVYIDTVAYFMVMVFSLYLWTHYVVAYLGGKNRFNSFLTRVGMLLFAFMTIALIINFFTPFVFEFDEEGIYSAKIGRIIALYAQIALFIITFIYSTIVAFKQSGKTRHHHYTIAASGAIMAVFIIIQSLYPLMPYYSVGLLISTSLIHTFIVQDERTEWIERVGSAREIAYRDPLTGVKSVAAYDSAKNKMDMRIKRGTVEAFGIIVFDLNNLKDINDVLGHDEGDRYIKEGCSIICHTFQHSPVFRIGGDEFVAILEGGDYSRRLELLSKFDRQMDINNQKKELTISSGMGIYRPGEDSSYDDVFARADKVMYVRKGKLKKISDTVI